MKDCARLACLIDEIWMDSELRQEAFWTYPDFTPDRAVSEFAIKLSMTLDKEHRLEVIDDS